MSNKYQEISDAILNGIGGKDNVSSCTHCVTRLRFIIKDRSLVDEAALKSISGVLGTQWSGDQLQVIVGQIVDEAYDLICAQAGFETHEAIDENLDGNLGTRYTAKDIPKMALDALSGCIFPIIPIIIPAGIIQLIASILGPNLLNVLPADSDLITLFTFVGNTGFYFIPIFAAWSASTYFKTSTPIAIFLGVVLIHPTLLQLVTDGTPFTVYGIPMQLVTYSSQFLPSVLSVWIMSYVYKFIKKHMPESLRYAFLPLCTILIMLPIELCAIGPLGSGIGVVNGAIATWLANVAGPVAIGLIGGLWYFLVQCRLRHLFPSRSCCRRDLPQAQWSRERCRLECNHAWAWRRFRAHHLHKHPSKQSQYDGTLRRRICRRYHRRALRMQGIHFWHRQCPVLHGFRWRRRNRFHPRCRSLRHSFPAFIRHLFHKQQSLGWT